MDPRSESVSAVGRVTVRDLDLVLDRTSPRPLYAQLAEQLKQRIDRLALPPGTRLPSSRDFAAELDVHRKTVVQAFRLLELEGTTASGVGRGTFVGGAPADNGASFGWAELGVDTLRAPDELRDFLMRQPAPQDAVRFTGATPDPEQFPADDLRAVLDEVLRTEGTRALDYGPAAGLHSLREWVAERLSGRGIPTDVSQVLIVNGSQQGLDLVARALLRPGDRVLVEEPSYSNGFRLFQSHGARIDAVATDDRGLVPAALENALRRESARLLYVMPIFQNPTGAVLGPERIEPILDLAAAHQLPILEDHFDAELVYEGEDPEPIKRRDARDQVILLGTFSKILFPGLRLGWLVLPEALVEPVLEVKQMADLSSGLLVQYALDSYCRRGWLDRHLTRVRRVNGERLRVLLDTLRREMPAEAAWTTPRGGMTVWLRLPPGVDSLSLLQTARRLGVDFSPGPLFFPNGGGGQFLRISYVREREERIVLGVERLAEAIREEMGRRTEERSARPFV